MRLSTKILITGAKGQLGTALRRLSHTYQKADWVFADRAVLDLGKPDQLAAKLTNICPTLIINCAAYTAVDKAESEPVLADLLNHQAVAMLSKWASKNHCKLIHLSTDYVFDGQSRIPLKEDAETRPINVYGATKLAGEVACRHHHPEAIILRTSWVYSPTGSNFVKTMVRLMQEKQSLEVVNDQLGSPTYATDLAAAILAIIQHPSWEPGTYHFSNEGMVSWYDFSLAIKEIGGFDCSIKGVPSSAYPTLAKRPSYSLLDKTKIENTYHIKAPNYKESLRRCMEIVQNTESND